MTKQRATTSARHTKDSVTRLDQALAKVLGDPAVARAVRQAVLSAMRRLQEDQERMAARSDVLTAAARLTERWARLGRRDRKNILMALACPPRTMNNLSVLVDNAKALGWLRPRRAGRRYNLRRRILIDRVLDVLADHGIPLKKSRTGKAMRVVYAALTGLGEPSQPTMEDQLFRELATAITARSMGAVTQS